MIGAQRVALWVPLVLLLLVPIPLVAGTLSQEVAIKLRDFTLRSLGIINFVMA